MLAEADLDQRANFAVSLVTGDHAVASIDGASNAIPLPCAKCKVWDDVPNHYTAWTCSKCNSRSLFQKCSSCGAPVQVLATLSEWNCPLCQGLCKESRSETKLIATAVDVQEELVRRGLYTQDPNKTFLTGCTVLSVQGHEVPVGTQCTVTLLSDGMVVAPVNRSYLPKHYSFSEVIAVDVGGSGAVQRGGGFSGGGFGVVGAIGGLAAAAVLNKATTKVSINNVIKLVTRNCAYVIENSTYNPASLRLTFTPLQNRLLQLEAGRRLQPSSLAATQLSAPPSGADKYERLSKLGELLSSGILSDQEFRAEKAKLLAE